MNEKQKEIVERQRVKFVEKLRAEREARKAEGQKQRTEGEGSPFTAEEIAIAERAVDRFAGKN